MTKQEFKDTLAKYEDVINDLTNGLYYIDGQLDCSISNCKDNCYIFLYNLDDYITVAEWSDDGKVIIYVCNELDEYIPEHIFETTEELDFWLSHKSKQEDTTSSDWYRNVRHLKCKYSNYFKKSIYKV